ncbi:MAG TPA: amphi-Trp domain-containing protein, partial [Anaeromyxobacteraceae bacterium]|nr:amphi-Trp domain-containing protein [Anaeromyxobacteraceae bacterium]
LNVSRTEAAQRIESLLDELALGSVTVGHETIRVPEDVHVEVKAKEDGLELELEWEPSDAVYGDPEDEEDGADETDEEEERAGAQPTDEIPPVHV